MTASGSIRYVTVTSDPWPKRLSVHIGQQLRRYRDDQDVLARELADRTEKLGHRVETNVIANMESGRRGNVPVADLLVLARALNIPPALLLCPLGQAEDLEPLPNWNVDAWAGFEWVTGFEVGSESQMVPEAGRVITAYHQHWRRLTALTGAPGTAEQKTQRALLLGAVRAEMRAAGWAPPKISEDLERLIAEAESLERYGATESERGDDRG